MKQLSITLVVIAVIGLLVYTNPKLDDYDRFINRTITEKTEQNKDPLVGIVGSFLSGFAAKVITQQTRRDDYLIFSTYDTPIGNKHIRVIGVLNRFYITDDEALKKL